LIVAMSDLQIWELHFLLLFNLGPRRLEDFLLMERALGPVPLVMRGRLVGTLLPVHLVEPVQATPLRRRHILQRRQALLVLPLVLGYRRDSAPRLLHIHLRHLLTLQHRHHTTSHHRLTLRRVQATRLPARAIRLPVRVTPLRVLATRLPARAILRRVLVTHPPVRAILRRVRATHPQARATLQRVQTTLQRVQVTHRRVRATRPQVQTIRLRVQTILLLARDIRLPLPHIHLHHHSTLLHRHSTPRRRRNTLLPHPTMAPRRLVTPRRGEGTLDKTTLQDLDLATEKKKRKF